MTEVSRGRRDDHSSRLEETGAPPGVLLQLLGAEAVRRVIPTGPSHPFSPTPPAETKANAEASAASHGRTKTSAVTCGKSRGSKGLRPRAYVYIKCIYEIHTCMRQAYKCRGILTHTFTYVGIIVSIYTPVHRKVASQLAGGDVECGVGLRV